MMQHIQDRAQNALQSWFCLCDYSRARRALDVLAGLAIVALGLAVAWGVLCALSQAQAVGVLMLPLALLARRGR